MSLEAQARRGSRVFERAQVDFKPKKLAGCFGGVTGGIPTLSGSALGQGLIVLNSTTNLLFNTYAPAIPPWVLNGAANYLGLSQAASWDANFICSIWRANNGVADFASNPTIVNVGLGTANIGAQFSDSGSSTSARFGVNWTGGAARFDSIDINPQTGAILAASANISNIQISTFPVVIAGSQHKIVKVSFNVPILPGGTNAGEFRLFPSLTAGAATVFAGGFEVDQLGPATGPAVFTPTPLGATASSPFGIVPRISTDRTIVPRTLAANYIYQNVLDNGSEFNITVNSVQIALPAVGNPGEWFDVYFSGTTFCTLAGSGGTLIRGAGLAPGGIGILSFPYDGANNPSGGVGPYNVCGMHLTCTAAGVWTATAIAEAHGTILFTTNGTFTPGDGLTKIWVDSAAGGGGGGGAAAVNSAAGGGGAGQVDKDSAFTVAPGTGVSITIGAAGNGGAAGTNQGTAGGNTIVGALATYTGGAPGNGSSTASIAAGGAAGGGGGQNGDAGFLIAGTLAFGGAGGSGRWGIGGTFTEAAGATAVNGKAAANLGAGGSGGSSGATGGTAAGGNGSQGFASVRW